MERLFKAIFITAFAALILTNPWFDGLDLLSVPGWRTISESEKLDKCISWEKEAAEDLGIEEIPTIEVRSTFNVSDTLCGMYQPWDNKIILYMDNIDDLFRAYNTVCHETRHAYQLQEINNGTEIGKTFSESYVNYVTYDTNEKDYRSQYIEVDARDYATKRTLSNWAHVLF
ncbi:MAG: hypothetical protein MJ246_08380 [Clostridia bacterium]|nr:hypothetical protein [Clostridia bacterium]